MPKDYYMILGVSPQATPDEIRRSYRRLAMAYHPDKQGDDKVALAHFREIQEAYETLRDPVKKEAYLQERWYERSMGVKASESLPLTPANILKEVISLERYIAIHDPFRMDQSALMAQLQRILSDDAVDMLTCEGEPDLLNNIGRLLLKCGQSFSLPEAEALASRLYRIYPDGHPVRAACDRYLSGKKTEYRWRKWKFPVLLLATLLLCLIIFQAGK
jgi:molecular chaperone DnaJ